MQYDLPNRTEVPLQLKKNDKPDQLFNADRSLKFYKKPEWLKKCYFTL